MLSGQASYQAILVGSGLALALMGAVAACWRAYPPAWRRPRSGAAVRFVLVAFLLTCTTTFFGARSSAATAAIVLVAVSILWLSRARHARRVQRAIDGTAGGKDVARSVTALRAALGKAPFHPRRYVAWSAVVAHAAGHLSRAGLYREALDIAGLLDVARLDPLMTWVHGQLVAATSLALGDRARARAELERLSAPAPTPLYDRAVAALATLLDVLDGRGAEVETLATRIAAETNTTSPTTLRAARAHALAANGERDEALVVLRRLRDGDLGTRALERVAMHAGPASRLASALLVEDSPPYR